MRYFPLRKKELNRIKREVCSKYPKVCDVIEEAKVGHQITDDDIVVIALDNIPSFITDEDWTDFIPTLVLARKAGMEAFHHAVVDEGAVKHLLNGANVMAPGITEVSEFSEGDIVVVWGPDKKTPLVVGKALMNANDVMTVRRGKAIKTLHYAGDKVWKVCLLYIRQTKK